MLQLVQAMPGELLSTTALIDPVPGIEKDSCGWSAAMVLEHLIRAGAAFGQMAIELSNGEHPWGDLDLAALMPEGDEADQVMADYRAFLSDFARALSEDVGDRNCPLTYPHPRHGALNAHGWHCLAAFHQRMHRQQMERIVGTLRIRKPR